MQTKDLLPSKHGRTYPAQLIITLALALLLLPGPTARAASSPAAITPPWSGAADASAVDDLTGTDDAAEVTTASLCSAPAPGLASCAAEALVLKHGHGHGLIHPHLQRPSSIARTQLRTRATAAGVPQADGDVLSPDSEPAAAPLPQAGTPAFLQQAYDLTYLSETAGGNATVGIVDAYADPTAASDLATYRAQYGLPACTTANGCLTVDAQTSTTDAGWDGETSLDLDAVSAICPNCHIVLVEAPTASLSDLVNAIQTAHSLGATYISNSWGEAGGAMADSGFSFSGSTTFAASGDAGYSGDVQYPASLPDVTAVGGTSLSYAPQVARGYTETAWADPAYREGTGSGCNASEAKPSWQTGDDTGCSGRSYNDIAADADPATGLDVYSSTYGGWVAFGGTSLATPMTAAYYALIGNLGATAAWPYQHTSVLNDVTSGSNVVSLGCPTDPGICSAGIGFDGPTGNGTISGDSVPGAPGIGSNGYSAGVTGSSATITVGVYPNSTATQVYLEYGPAGQGYTSHTEAQGVGSSAQAVQATFNLNGVAPGYHYRVVASNGYGTTYGYDVSLSTADGWPAVTSASVSATSATTAQASYSVNYEGSGSLQIVYGPSAAYGLTSATQTGTGTAAGSVTLSGLAPNTTYHWATVITNGTATFTTPDGTFTTPAGAPGGSPSGASGSGSGASGAGGSSGSGASASGSGSSGSGAGGSGAGGPGAGGPGAGAAGGPSNKGLTVISVKGSAGHYDVKVTCTAVVGCAGHVTLSARLPGGRTRALGTADVTLRQRASVTIRFITGVRAPVMTAVAARAGNLKARGADVTQVRRSRGRSPLPDASWGRRRSLA